MRIRKFAIVACAIATGLVMQKDTCLAVGNEYDTAIEADYGDKFNYVNSNRLPGSPLEAESADGVDTATGHLILSRNDLYLEGTGGMDFELNRYYDSNEANIGHPTVEVVEELKMETVWVHYTTQEGTEHQIVVHPSILQNHKKALKDLLVTYTKGETKKKVELSSTQRTKIVSNETYNTYGISSGWRFDFPWIETVTIKEESGDGWSAKPAYLHMGSKGTMDIATTVDTANKSYTITGLKGYNYSDVKLEDWNQNVDGVACRYLLRDKTGLRTYFNADGVVVMQKDAHNNTIHYTYQDQIYFDKITDSVGREICFHYSTTENGLKTLDSVTVQGQEIAGGVSKKTVTYTTEEKTYTPLNSEELYGLVLTSATVDGSKETYDYRTVERLVNTAGAGIASQRVSTNESYLLKKTTWDGCEQHYEYRACSIRGPKCESGAEDRDVVVENFYVTREYSKDAKTGKKTDGIKYDYFQKQDDTLISYADFQESENELWQYGREGLQTVTVVSRFNPNKYKTNGKFYDYTYTTADIDVDTLRLSADTDKEVSLCIYNVNKLVTDVVAYSELRAETLFEYDDGGNGSLVTLEVEKKLGETTNISKVAYEYDLFRNVTKETTPQAFLEKNKDKKHLYITDFTYFNTDKSYPIDASECYNFALCKATETYADSTSILRKESRLEENGVDIKSITGSVKKEGDNFVEINHAVYNYDKNGNMVKETLYPNYDISGIGEAVTRKYAFNALGQKISTTIDIQSNEDSSQNRSYVEERVTYDSFGNELSNTDMNGNTTKYRYDEETGNTKEILRNVGTENEGVNKEYVSDNKLKTMTVDDFDMCTIRIMDAFGNTLIEKNEKTGIWIEREYDYGDTESDSEEKEESEGEVLENGGLLIEERVYAFLPNENKFITDGEGNQIANFDMGGKGDTLLSSSCYAYNEQGECIIEAGFLGDTMDAQSCISWKISKVLEEIETEYTIETSYEKILDPTEYVTSYDKNNYYTEYDNYVLVENIIETKTNTMGNIVENSSTVKQNGQMLITTTKNAYDEMEREIEVETVTKKIKDGEEETKKEKIFYVYDFIGNITEMTTSKQTNDSQKSETYTVRMEYDSQGRLLSYYDAKGSDAGYATQYKYNLAGQVVEMDIPVSEENGEIIYNTTKNEYSNNGKLIATETTQDGGENSRTEYSYDSNGNLILVKNCLDARKAQYTQYLYDIQGNQIRQYTGMTSPIKISLKETKDTDGDYSYAGKKYKIELSGENKKDIISEFAYEYNQKDQLISYRDPEGRIENYKYDIYGNLIQTIDNKNNKFINKYNRWNQLIEEKAIDIENKEEITHIYQYDLLGNLIYADGIVYEYNDITGGVTREYQKNENNIEIEKKYGYDEAGNETSFFLEVDRDTVLDYSYNYDSLNRLVAVNLKDKEGENRLIAQYTYDANDNLTTTTLPNVDIITEYSYNLNNSVTNMSICQGKDYEKKLAMFQINYSENGQICAEESSLIDIDEEGKEQKNRKISSITYEYDRLGRLVQETNTNGEKMQYSYDANNNRSKMTYQNIVTDYHYNKNGELLRSDTLDNTTSNLQTTLYKNDKNGNQIAVVNRRNLEKHEEYFDLEVSLGANRLNDNVVYHYNAMNQLTEALTGNNKVQYEYNADGLREIKRVNGKDTIYIWDGDQLVLELNGNGKVKKRYIRGNGLLFYDEGENTKQFYYVTDAHGDVVQLVNEGGVVEKTYEYDSFGNEKNIEKKDENPFRYGGEYYDKETNTLYLRERNYSSGLGRFLTRDSYTGEDNNPLSLNSFTFCENNPVSQMDYNGNWPEPLKKLKEAKKKVKSWSKKVKEHAGEQLSNLNDTLQKTSAKVKKTKAYKTAVGVSAIYAEMGLFDNNLFKLGGFVKSYDRETHQTVYYTKRKCLQRFAGYNNFYDYVFDLATDMNANKVEFANNKFVLWMWKGDYLNLGAGGEVGIYRKFKGGHWYVNRMFSLKMTLQLYLGGQKLYNRKPIVPQWWITGFVPAKSNVKATDLTLTGTIGFTTVPTIKYWNSFKNSSKNEEKSKIWKTHQDKILGGIATFNWK